MKTKRFLCIAVLVLLPTTSFAGGHGHGHGHTHSHTEGHAFFGSSNKQTGSGYKYGFFSKFFGGKETDKKITPSVSQAYNAPLKSGQYSYSGY